MVGETINPPGNWSSYPPHKHDGRDGEPVLEEVYYYRISPPQGFGQQMLYTTDGESTTHTVKDGDAVLLPYGYHPVSAPPGYKLYYLWAMAGTERKLALHEDPAHTWLHKALGREATVRRSSELGVVAVIRMRDAGKLRAVVDAHRRRRRPRDRGHDVGAGRDRADRKAGAARCRRRFLLGAGTVIDADDGARGDRCGRAVHRQSGVPARGHRRLPRARRRRRARLLHPDRNPGRARARRRHREGLSGDGARPADSSKTSARRCRRCG